MSKSLSIRSNDDISFHDIENCFEPIDENGMTTLGKAMHKNIALDLLEDRPIAVTAVLWAFYELLQDPHLHYIRGYDRQNLPYVCFRNDKQGVTMTFFNRSTNRMADYMLAE